MAESDIAEAWEELKKKRFSKKEEKKEEKEEEENDEEFVEKKEETIDRVIAPTREFLSMHPKLPPIIPESSSLAGRNLESAVGGRVEPIREEEEEKPKKDEKAAYTTKKIEDDTREYMQNYSLELRQPEIFKRLDIAEIGMKRIQNLVLPHMTGQKFGEEEYPIMTDFKELELEAESITHVKKDTLNVDFKKYKKIY